MPARLKNVLRGGFLVLGLKESMVEFATVCVKSEVILSGLCQKKVLLSGKEMAFPDT